MKVLITANAHRAYDRTGEVVRRIGPIGNRYYWIVRLDTVGDDWDAFEFEGEREDYEDR